MMWNVQHLEDAGLHWQAVALRAVAEQACWAEYGADLLKEERAQAGDCYGNHEEEEEVRAALLKTCWAQYGAEEESGDYCTGGGSGRYGAEDGDRSEHSALSEDDENGEHDEHDEEGMYGSGWGDGGWQGAEAGGWYGGENGGGYGDYCTGGGGGRY